ncbi:MAG: hypothetical protein M0C28_47625 [Candidatus Moduliflexus flocculans]|nr:hypothetical protein [Candidatus Moduliflexus flocculans]
MLASTGAPGLVIALGVLADDHAFTSAPPSSPWPAARPAGPRATADAAVRADEPDGQSLRQRQLLGIRRELKDGRRSASAAPGRRRRPRPANRG